MEIKKKGDVNRGQGARRPADRKPFGRRPSSENGERREFGPKSYADKPFGRRTSSENAERRESGSKSYADKPFGRRTSSENRERREFGPSREKREFGRPSERSSYGRKSYGDKPFERKPYERKTYGDKDFERKPYDSRRKAEPKKQATAHKADKALSTEVRLNKFIANSGVCSRREADRLIEAGVVTVNGVVVTELGTRIDMAKDTVLFGDQRLRGEEKVYIVMNKPKGFVTTTSDPHAEQTVMDLLTKCPSRVFPVGRLDKNTTGVLLFTNDGVLAEKLTHPSYEKKKIYEVDLDKALGGDDFDRILQGIELEDGPIAADELSYIDATDKRKVGIEIHSGKNHIVRRIFESLGYQVKALDRVYFAGLTKKGIKRGQWRYLSEGEVNLLKMGAFK